MRVSPLLAVAALAVTGCAKFPKDQMSDFTRLSFSFRLSGNADPKYIYGIAIRPLTTTTGQTDTLGPVPVVVSGSREGLVAGRPTRWIQYSPGQGFAVPYRVQRFVGASSDTSDPDPGTLVDSSFPISGSDPTNSGFPGTLSFDITTRDLADSDDAARAIVAFQFNILTMDKTARNSADIGTRAFDALGDQRSQNTTSFNDYRRIVVTTSGKYSNTGQDGGQSSSTQEGERDVFNAPQGTFPALDIVDWSVEVRPQ